MYNVFCPSTVCFRYQQLMHYCYYTCTCMFMWWGVAYTHHTCANSCNNQRFFEKRQGYMCLCPSLTVRLLHQSQTLSPPLSQPPLALAPPVTLHEPLTSLCLANCSIKSPDTHRYCVCTCTCVLKQSEDIDTF